MSRMGRELGEQRMLDAATIVRDRPGLLPAAGVDAALADVLEALAPLAPTGRSRTPPRSCRSWNGP